MKKRKSLLHAGAFLALAITLCSSFSPAQSPGWICVTPYGWGFLERWQPPGTTCAIIIDGVWVIGKAGPVPRKY